MTEMPLLDTARKETLIMVSNREPYEHVSDGDETQVRRPSGGLVSALHPTMARLNGTWVAWGSGSADAENADASGRVSVPPEDPRFTLRRVWLDDADVERYYLGFANSVLWPLCHALTQHVEFEREDWERYAIVNERFAEAVLDEAQRNGGEAVVWVHDYHFALLPATLRARRPDLFVHQFWHVPFPRPALMATLPTAVRNGILRGLLGNDLVAFQTARDAQNFLDCVEALPGEVKVESETEVLLEDGRRVHVGAFPISIDVEGYESLAQTPESERRVREIRARYAGRGRALGVCVDRVDYTKGIPERLRALDLLWANCPEVRRRFTFIIVATPSRTELPVYRELESQMVTEVARINERHGSADWTPIVLINEDVDASLLAVMYRAADLCVVSSLQDGMNLVAKEFIACQVDGDGVLVLSRFAGAAEEIDDAVLIDPRDAQELADGIREALEMSADERRARMQRMRDRLHRATIFHWLDDLQRAVSGLRVSA